MSLEFWRDRWDSNHRYPSGHVKRLMSELHADGLLGSVVMDLGSGTAPVTEGLKSSGYRLVWVDPGARRVQEGNDGLLVPLSLEQLIEADQNPDLADLVLRIRSFCQPYARRPRDAAYVDTVVMSNVFNYVDPGYVVPGLRPLLKPTGRFVVANETGLGDESEFHPCAARSKDALVGAFEVAGFRLEEDFLATRSVALSDLSREELLASFVRV